MLHWATILSGRGIKTNIIPGSGYEGRCQWRLNVFPVFVGLKFTVDTGVAISGYCILGAKKISWNIGDRIGRTSIEKIRRAHSWCNPRRRKCRTRSSKPCGAARDRLKTIIGYQILSGQQIKLSQQQKGQDGLARYYSTHKFWYWAEPRL